MDSLQEKLEDTKLTEQSNGDTKTDLAEQNLGAVASDDPVTSDGQAVPDATAASDSPAVPDAPVDWKRTGDEHLAYKRYEDAIMAYTIGIEEGDRSVDILANRSCAYLGIHKFKHAFDDAEEALKIDKKHIKCISRKAKSLFGLGLYKVAMKFLDDLKGHVDSHSRITVDVLLLEAKNYLVQEDKGDYPWSELYRGKKIYHEMADYTKLVTVNQTATKGRGLFATRNIKAGELICASKAVAYVEDSTESSATVSLRFMRGGVTEIHHRLITKTNELMLVHPEKFKLLAKLYAGPELTYLNDDTLVYDEARDLKRIELISLFNSISCPQRIDGSFCRSAGLWIIPSFINHSCVDANSSYTIIGDFIFVRAFKDIPAGGEIEMPYKVPTALVAQERLLQYNFICQCRLCRRDRLDDANIRAQRADLLNELETVLAQFAKPKSYENFRKADAIRIEGLFQKFDDSRPDAPDLNLCYVSKLFEYGKIRLGKNRYASSVALFEKIFDMTKDVAGFEIYTILSCIKISLCHALSGDRQTANQWALALKKHTRLFFGTVHILHTQFSQYILTLRSHRVEI